MDDSLDSVDSEEEAVELCNHLTHVWGEAGMVARKWLSNSAEVMEAIPLDKRAGNVEIISKYLGVWRLMVVTSQISSYTYMLMPQRQLWRL